MELKEFTKLKDEMERLQRQADKTAGALELLYQRLKEDFNCDSLEEAKSLSSKMTKKCAKLKDELNPLLQEYKKKWGEKLL